VERKTFLFCSDGGGEGLFLVVKNLCGKKRTHQPLVVVVVVVVDVVVVVVVYIS
jgi:hypothetical protein